jgi:hypothetical protein
MTWSCLMQNCDVKSKKNNEFPFFYSKLLTKNCGQNGDCLFYCLKDGFQENNPFLLSSEFNKIVKTQRLTMSMMRFWLSQTVTLETIKNFLLVTLQDVLLVYPDSYSAAHFLPLIGFRTLQDFSSKIKKGDQLSRLISSKNWTASDVNYVRKLIQSSGYKYQGTELSLFFLRDFLRDQLKVNLGFVIFGRTPETVILIGDPQTSHFMLLYNQDNYHWLLVSVQVGINRYDSIVTRELLVTWFPKGQLLARPTLF